MRRSRFGQPVKRSLSICNGKLLKDSDSFRISELLPKTAGDLSLAFDPVFERRIKLSCLFELLLGLMPLSVPAQDFIAANELVECQLERLFGLLRPF